MPIADLASSFNAFFESAATFFRHLSEVRWTPLALALLLLAAMEVARAWSWRNALRAAYPQASIPFPSLCAAYLAGAGVNAIAPARAGDVTKVFLAKRQVLGSSYPAVTSSFLVLSIFDTAAGLLVLLYAVSQGLLPQPPTLPNLPAFEISFWAAHPQAFLIAVASLILAIAVAVFLLAHHVRRFWERVRQGVAILTRPRRYLREVAAWQAVGWLCRFAAFWFFFEAFGIGASVGGVMLVMSVQAISTIVPLTPGGAGAQQALLVATLSGPSRAAVLSFSVGTQIATAAWSVALGFGSMLLVFRTTDWRGLIRQAETDAAAAEAAVPVQN
ncbi:MAG TPA: lysylphosphatidylglycerol synthase transmembrane domain-containing protein [Solirubrobacterales bacterium]